jgi:hypothetical protein
LFSTLREEHRLRVFETRVLRRILGLKRDEETYHPTRQNIYSDMCKVFGKWEDSLFRGILSRILNPYHQDFFLHERQHEKINFYIEPTIRTSALSDWPLGLMFRHLSLEVMQHNKTH